MDKTAIIGTSLSDATRYLNENNVVAIPTETVYGLAGNALNRDAVVRIFEVKARPAFDPLIVHTHAVSEFHKYADIDSRTESWMSKLSPGPITYILPKKEIIPDLVTSGHTSVGLRVPRHELTLSLLRSLEFPLAAPSANPFGYVSPTQASHVADQLGSKIPYILDGGPCDVGIESTIIDLTQKQPIVLRLGGYELGELEDLTGQKLDNIRLSSSTPHAPGMLQSHYAPNVKLFRKEVSALLEEYPGAKVGALRYASPDAHIPEERQLILTSAGNSAEAAKNLFRYLRKLDEMDLEIVSVEFAPDEGLGKAINDRLTRAVTR